MSKDEKLPPEVTPRIVSAAMVSANTGQMGGAPKSDKALYIEKAMSDAVQKCYDLGTTETNTVREAITKARDEAEASWEAGVENG